MAGSIKDGDGMPFSESIENYLKAILIMKRRGRTVRRIDLAHYMGYSKASISYAVRILAQKGCIELDGDHIELTEEGKKLSEDVLEKNQFFTDMLIRCGVDRMKAQEEACALEHVISDETFSLIKDRMDRIAQLI